MLKLHRIIKLKKIYNQKNDNFIRNLHHTAMTNEFKKSENMYVDIVEQCGVGAKKTVYQTKNNVTKEKRSLVTH